MSAKSFGIEEEENASLYRWDFPREYFLALPSQSLSPLSLQQVGLITFIGPHSTPAIRHPGRGILRGIGMTSALRPMRPITASVLNNLLVASGILPG
jgi:hypothetical protein